VKKFNPLKKISFASLHTGFDFFEKKKQASTLTEVAKRGKQNDALNLLKIKK